MLLTEETKKVINLAEIGRGSLISAKNKTWDKAQSGSALEGVQGVEGSNPFIPTRDLKGNSWKYEFPFKSLVGHHYFVNYYSFF